LGLAAVLEQASLRDRNVTSSQRTALALPVAESWARIAMKRKWFVLAIIIILIALVWLFREGMTT
jgi:t-SNARE complex subunit (syntaxin)